MYQRSKFKFQLVTHRPQMVKVMAQIQLKLKIHLKKFSQARKNKNSQKSLILRQKKDRLFFGHMWQ